MAEKDHSERVIPGNEQRCVWMDAGLIGYQLCTRRYECTQCPVESSLRREDRKPTDAGAGKTRPASAARKDLSASYLYTRNHWWLHKLAGRPQDNYRIGIEPFLAQLIAYPKEVVLPAVGTRLQAGEYCAWIVLKGGTIPLRAPLTGTVTNINRHLRGNPHSLMNDPLLAGWMMDIREASDLHPHLLDKKQAVLHYAKEKERFTTMLCNATRRTALDVGTTLADGGSFVANLGEVIGQKKIYSLILEIISA